MSISSRTRSKSREREEGSLLLKLPEEIHNDIFLKLPGKSILASRCVCKLFYNLLSSPIFIKIHLSRTIQTKNNPKLLCFHQRSRKNNTPMIYSIPIDYASISSTSSADGAVLINYPFEFNKSYEHKNILGSCNGLVCLKIESFDRAENERGELSHTWYYTILNPLTGEYKDFLGPPSHGSKPRYSDCKITYGFGYDSNLDDYKLAIVSDFEKAGCFKIDIYTVKLNSWSHTQGPLNYSFRCGGERSRFRNLGNKASYGVFLNGSLHWLGFSGSITTQGTSSEVIIYFDISNGTVVNMPLPENLMASLDLVGRRHMNMGVWGDCICIAARTCVWVMQEYGVEESWMRRYTRTQLIAIGEMQGELIGPFVPYNQPLWCFHNGEILINNCRENLRLYDPTNETVRSVVVCDITMDEDRESYVESLVSLGSGTYMEKQIPHGQRLR